MSHKLIALGLITIIIAYLAFYVIPVEKREFLGGSYTYTYAAIDNQCSDSKAFFENFGHDYNTSKCEEASNFKALTWIIIIIGIIILILGSLGIIKVKRYSL